MNCRIQKHETSAYLHMIRHFSPFHAPHTPPLMGMESDNSAPGGGSALLQAASSTPPADTTTVYTVIHRQTANKHTDYLYTPITHDYYNHTDDRVNVS